MANEAISHSQVPFDDFAMDLEGFLDHVVHSQEVLTKIDRDEVILLKPVRFRRRRVITDADHRGFLSAGSWRDVGAYALITYIRKSRHIATCPEIEL